MVLILSHAPTSPVISRDCVVGSHQKGEAMLRQDKGKEAEGSAHLSGVQLAHQCTLHTALTCDLCRLCGT